MASQQPPPSQHNTTPSQQPHINTADDERGRLASDAASSATTPSDPIKYPGTVLINVQGAFIEVETPELPRTPGGTVHDYHHDTSDIVLPNHKAVVSHIAVDIGGSLAKLVYFSHEHKSLEAGGRLNFLKFETDKIDSCIDFMRQLKLRHEQLNGHPPPGRPGGELCIMATGGGAFKFYDRIKDALGVEVLREDEMECLIIGLDFFINEIPNEVFTYSEESPMSFRPRPDPADPLSPSIYPYLLVNIGSGVSMIKVLGPRNFTRVGGTSLGGGTLWGLLSLLTGARNFDEMLKSAESGDNTAVDMLVGDIYGSGYGKIGLKSSTIASSFGKVYRMKREAEREAEDGGGLANGDRKHGRSGDEEEDHGKDGGDTRTFKAEDISRSLLYAVSNNIGQIAYLHAEKHGLEHIYFGGSFIGGHRQTMNTLSYAIKFWSKGEKQAYFLRHEGYLGSVGAFLKRQPPNWGRRNSLDAGAGMGNVLERIGSRT
ncbi:pantothenate kinase [Aulographum hederae CBS 113979]|uniref:Pantothenate kinase n=1 Tax=Aulographum hederae CBS 113979 TaxID=1176131 RepID=A0A6G1H2F0_9PEZI|nr:pantothenate kinase [Aulographum hederae CBS 113979]